MTVSSSDDVPGFLIRMAVDMPSSVNREEVSRVVDYLGGTATKVGFAFPSDQRRTAALKVLIERFGPNFAAVNEPPRSNS
jgi:hypothetical protein